MQTWRIFHTLSASAMVLRTERAGPAVEAKRVGFSIECGRTPGNEETRNTVNGS
jgi:hypothetical protein